MINSDGGPIDPLRFNFRDEKDRKELEHYARYIVNFLMSQMESQVLSDIQKISSGLGIVHYMKKMEELGYSEETFIGPGFYEPLQRLSEFVEETQRQMDHLNIHFLLEEIKNPSPDPKNKPRH
ncbi:MAG: hypothetical protein IID18_01855 [Nitrospinae bacterium]|nr:hypothetical protein [Nitrospinota bacterium]